MGSTYKVKIEVPRHVQVEGRTLDRESFFAWAWKIYAVHGLVGVHEGTLLTEQASEEGLETETWTVDSGEAPRERDWVGGRKLETAELYFDSLKGAETVQSGLKKLTGLKVIGIEEQKPQDWDAEWKASFQGAVVPPFWQVLPPWVNGSDAKAGGNELILRINPGAGFGTGTHETTQLCLQLMGERALRSRNRFQGLRALDFGSGSGILSIGAALLGAQVDGVEIDSLANENATENAALNALSFPIRFEKEMKPSEVIYDLVIANILRPVLIEFAEALVSRLAPQGTMILSGLIESDVAPILAKYESLLPGMKADVRALNEWRAIAWQQTEK